eukprot:3706179-Pyramimonas_sp.AAC.1
MAGSRGRPTRTATHLEEVTGKRGPQICGESGPLRGGLETRACPPHVQPHILLPSAPPSGGSPSTGLPRRLGRPEIWKICSSNITSW